MSMEAGKILRHYLVDTLKIFTALVERNGSVERLIVNANDLKAHRTASSLLKKGLFPNACDEQKEA